MRVKIIYEDGTHTGVVEGPLIAEDEHFFRVQDKDGLVKAIGKRYVQKLVEVA